MAISDSLQASVLTVEQEEPVTYVDLESRDLATVAIDLIAPAPSHVADRFTRVYADRKYLHATTVSHLGKVIAFALDDQQRVYYTVLDLDRTDVPSSGDGPADDRDFWDTEPRELLFPRELDRVGFDVGGPFPMPVVTRSGSIPLEGSPVEQADVDPFLSSTARLTADAPFQVLSDGELLYVVRQSIARSHPRIVYVQRSGGHVPVVDSSLLVDVFVLAGHELLPKREARFQRSRNRSLPAGPKDTLGPEDLEQKPFIQPTHELPFVRRLQDGRFALVLVPTALPDTKRWVIFADNARSAAIDVFDLEQGADGSFDTRGTRFFTCPNPKHRDVLKRDPGVCPIDGKDPLVPLDDHERAAGSCLHFGGADAVSCELGADLRNTSFTVELWARRASDDGKSHHAFGQGKDAKNQGLHIGFRGKKFTFDFFENGTDTEEIGDVKWHHWACVYDAEKKKQIIYRDGESVKDRDQVDAFTGSGPFFLGRAPWGDYFQGDLDEVRVWKRARSRDEIVTDMHSQLLGCEPGLITYWRLDEGQGRKIYDLTESGLDGTFEGTVSWVDRSKARVRLHPGVGHARLRFKGLKVASGLSAILYTQQENAKAGYEHQDEPMKQAVRLMLAAATVPEEGGAPATRPIAVLDMGVSALGRPAELPEIVALTPLAVKKPEDPKKPEDLPMPLVGFDSRGLSTYGARLDFAGTSGTLPDGGPQLFDAADRRVGLYFRGETDQLFAARYDTATARASFSLSTSAKGKPVRLVARTAGPALDAAVIEVADDPGKPGNPGNPGLCKVTIQVPGQQLQIWEEVPRTPPQFADVINGLAPELIETVGKLKTAVNGTEVQELTLEQGLARAFEKGTRLEVGKREVTLAVEAEAQATVLKIDKASLTSPAGSRIKLRKQGHPSHNKASLFFLADASKADGDIRVLSDKAEREGTVPTPGCRWKSDVPGTALRFDARDAQIKDVVLGAEGQEADRFSRKRNLTFETWVRPEESESPEEESFLITKAPAAGGYALGLRRRLKAALRFNHGGPGKTDRIEVSHDSILSQPSFTLSAWARVMGGDRENRCAVVFRGDFCGFALYADLRGRWSLLFGARKDDGSGTWDSLDCEEVSLNRWVHLAFTLEGKRISAYVNGRLRKTKEIKEFVPVPAERNPPFRIGAGEYMGGVYYPFVGDIAEVCYWKEALSAEAIADNWSRRLSPDEMEDPSLVGYWSFDKLTGNKVPNLAKGKEKLGGEVQGSLPKQIEHHPEPFAAAGGHLARSSRFVPLQHWSHVAGVYRQAHALRFEGNGYVDCGVDKRLGLTGDLTLEASFRVQDVTKFFPIAVKGLHGAEGEKMPCALWLDAGDIVFAFVDEEGNLQSVRSTRKVPAGGGIHQVAVTRETISSSVVFKVDEDKLKKSEIPQDLRVELLKIKESFTGKRLFLRKVREVLGSLLASRYQSLILSACQEPSGSGVTRAIEISLHLDGQEAGFHRYLGASPGSSDRPLEIGRSGSAKAGRVSYTYATGEIGELRLWNVACADADLWAPRRLIGREKGLVSWWQCTEGEGPVIRDACGGLVGVCHGVAWTPWDETSRLELLINGERDRNAELKHELPDLPDRSHLTLGSRLQPQVPGHFTGQLDEVRIWSTARSPQEIRENFHRHLTDEREHLIAYYDGEETGTAQVHDGSAYGHHLTATRPENVAWFSGGRVKFNQCVHALGRGVLWELWLQPDPKVTDQGARPVLWMPGVLQVLWDPGLKEVSVCGFFEERDGSPAHWLTASKAGIDPQVWTHVAGVAQGKTVRLYVNGELADARSLGRFSPKTDAAPWFLGADQETGDRVFKGWVREVRLWMQETPEDKGAIRDLMTRRLRGDEPGLLGWWPLNAFENGVFPNRGPQKIDGQPLAVTLSSRLRPVSEPAVLAALYARSSAPVGHDAPLVKGALSGIATDFHRTVGSRPSVREYGRAELVSGDLAAVLKRCYTWLQDGAWNLLTGFKVGDLDIEWLGQVQTRPQLIGFIEGAPPVPAENFKKEQSYPNASSIVLTEAEDTVQTYSRATACNTGLSIEMKAGGGYKSRTEVGAGVEATVEETEIEAGVTAGLYLSGDWLDSRQVSLATSRNKLSELHLTGAMVDYGEGNKKYKKFEAHNVGFALVQSETADLFALRLRHPQPKRRSLVAFTVRPNNEIPKDWNILTFRINPVYTKQGELDGGKLREGSYFNPREGSYFNPREGSYFNPREAYALKARIAREEEQIRAFYKTFSTGSLDNRSINLVETERQLRQDLPQPWKRNIVNTYIWTAAGGLFQETERTMDVREEVYRGDWAMSASLGGYFHFKGAYATVLGKVELNAQATYGLKLSTEKSQSSQTSFGVDVKLGNVERDVLDAHGRPLEHKVDAYRFMTFYLSPKEDHFTELFRKVIDPKWLAEDQSADAVTLRQLKAEGRGVPWRVLHRVTFVSRGVPAVGKPSDEVEKALQIAHIESNYALIRTLEPFVRDKVQDYEAFRKAASDAIRLYLPELDTENVRERVIDYLGFYFDVVRAS